MRCLELLFVLFTCLSYSTTSADYHCGTVICRDDQYCVGCGIGTPCRCEDKIGKFLLFHESALHEKWSSILVKLEGERLRDEANGTVSDGEWAAAQHVGCH